MNEISTPSELSDAESTIIEKCTVTIDMDTWDKLEECIIKTAALAEIAAEHDFLEDPTLETYMWVLRDYTQKAAKICEESWGKKLN